MNSLNLGWSPSYATGIQIIDDQHKRLFDYFDEVDKAITSRDTKNLEVIVHGLVSYAISHNAYEESLMEQAGYPMLVAHRAVHETFKVRAMDFLKKYDEGTDPLKVAEQARIFIGLWLTSHVKNDDQDYVPYVKKITNKGVFSTLLGKFFR